MFQWHSNLFKGDFLMKQLITLLILLVCLSGAVIAADHFPSHKKEHLDWQEGTHFDFAYVPTDDEAGTTFYARLKKGKKAKGTFTFAYLTNVEQKESTSLSSHATWYELNFIPDDPRYFLYVRYEGIVDRKKVKLEEKHMRIVPYIAISTSCSKKGVEVKPRVKNVKGLTGKWNLTIQNGTQEFTYESNQLTKPNEFSYTFTANDLEKPVDMRPDMINEITALFTGQIDKDDVGKEERFAVEGYLYLSPELYKECFNKKQIKIE